jgi:DNA-binding SARP family transcriptional activator
VEFGILGSLAVRVDGRELPLGAAKQRALLAALLLRAGEPVPVATLVGELWGEHPPATAVKAAQVYVSQLRKTLGEQTIETHPLGYLLRLDDDDSLDVRRFERLLDRGRRLLADGAAEEARSVLGEALALWRGPALADFRYDDFAGSEIRRLEELRLVALEQRLEADLALGRHGEAVPELEALVRTHPLRESLRRLLIVALYRSGRQADALAVYHDAKATLLDELGLDPGHSLQQLERAILVQDPSLDLPAPERVERPAREPAALEASRTATVLFCDVVAFGEPAGRLDPESLRHVLSRFFDEAAAVVERHGGTVEKFIGDELLAVFGVPAAREDDALRAVRAAVALRDCAAALDTTLGPETSLQLRQGVNTGEVVAGDAVAGHGFLTGETVAIGKRLEEAAAPGEILLGRGTHVLVAHAVAAAEVEPRVLRGLRGPERAFRLDRVEAAATALR